MEDVLDIYERPYNPEIPVICMDEKPYQLLDEIIQPLPIKPGSVRKTDYEYVRKGTCSIFIFVEPLVGKRHAKALEQRTKIDFAHQVKEFVDTYYSEQEKVIFVLDNLNTHNSSSFYEAFDAETARRLSRKIEFHYTPKHGSWLNIAEIELSVLSTQCIKMRIPSISALNSKLKAWATNRNLNSNKVDWQFTTDDARVKLKSLYPKF